MAEEDRKLVKKKPWGFSNLWEDENFLESFPFMRMGEHSGLTLFEDGGELVVEAALPGLTAADIDVTFENGVVWIKGERKEEKEDKERHYYRKSSRSFSYNVKIPCEVDEKVEPKAEYKDGVMRIRFNKCEKKEPRKIKIQSK